MLGVVVASHRRLPLLLLLLAVLIMKIAAQRVGRYPLVEDWPQFGWDAASSGAPSGATRITAANVASLTRRQVHLDGTVDASAVYLHQVTVNGSTRDVLFVTTSYGKTIAVDADKGTVLWEYTPP